MLYLFRTTLVHLQEQNFISYLSYLVYADPSGCCVAIATQQPDVSAYKGIYQIRHTAYKKIAPEDGLMLSETSRAYIEK